MLAREDGKALAAATAGPGNHEAVGYEGLAHVLKELLEHVLAAAGVPAQSLQGAGFGVAGYDWPGELQPTLDAIRRLGLACPVTVVNDVLLVLKAGAEQGWGIAVEAGTGCNCRGLDRRRREGRVTGAGSPLGEGAGASEMVAEAVKAISRDWSRRGPQTRLTQEFVHLAGARDADDLLEGLILGRYELTAEAVRVILETAQGGDEVASRIVQWAGMALADLVTGVARQLDLLGEEFELVTSGSVFKAGEPILGPFRRAVLSQAPGALLRPLQGPPAVGAVLLAMEQVGLEGRPFREVLLRQGRDLLPEG